MSVCILIFCSGSHNGLNCKLKDTSRKNANLKMLNATKLQHLLLRVLSDCVIICNPNNDISCSVNTYKGHIDR